jgi:hypothetical protein
VIRRPWLTESKGASDIRIFVPDGNPEGVRIIDQMNWTGLGIAFPRDQWAHVRQRNEFSKTGVYILVSQTEDDLPTLYIGFFGRA